MYGLGPDPEGKGAAVAVESPPRPGFRTPWAASTFNRFALRVTWRQGRRAPGSRQVAATRPTEARGKAAEMMGSDLPARGRPRVRRKLRK